MKNFEYVSTVTRIYRKYIDLALSKNPYIIDENDIKELMQVFNRGGFSSGNLDNEPNTSYVYPEKQNNQGLLLGQIQNYNSTKGLVTFKTKEEICINDTVCIQNEDHKYTVSELMINNQNIKNANINDIITIGRIKGKISYGDKIYKLTDYNKNKEINEFIKKENKKIPLTAVVTIKKGLPISLDVTSMDKENGSYFSMSSKKEIDLIPIESITNPITSQRINEQILKTTDTPFEFKNVKILLDENTYIPKISAINKLRRDCLEDLTNQAIKRFEREPKDKFTLENDNLNKSSKLTRLTPTNKILYSLDLEKINIEYDYKELSNIDRIYVPIKYFINKKYSEILNILKNKGDLYIKFPTILRDNYKNITFNSLDDFIKNYNIKGIVINNISGIDYANKYKDLNIIANYSLNVFNVKTIQTLMELGINTVTLSPELDKKTLQLLTKNSPIPTEFMVYGRVPLMNAGYCLLGKSNRCYPTCEMFCKDGNYYLKDRLGYNFIIVPDNMQTITTIYNSKILSIKYNDLDIDCAKISILDESINEINNIIMTVKNKNNFTGKNFTYGNLDKRI